MYCKSKTKNKLNCQGGQPLHQHFGVERPECCGYSLNEIFQGLSSRKIVKYNGLAGNLFKNLPLNLLGKDSLRDCSVTLRGHFVLFLFRNVTYCYEWHVIHHVL